MWLRWRVRGAGIGAGIVMVHVAMCWVCVWGMGLAGLALHVREVSGGFTTLRTLRRRGRGVTVVVLSCSGGCTEDVTVEDVASGGKAGGSEL